MPDSAIRPRKEFGKTIAADITHRLREEIIACGLAPGEPLRFDVLRERFGASFTTLREALTALAAAKPWRRRRFIDDLRARRLV